MEAVKRLSNRLSLSKRGSKELSVGKGLGDENDDNNDNNTEETKKQDQDQQPNDDDKNTEKTPEETMEELMGMSYKVALYFTNTHHTHLTDTKELKKVMARIAQIKKQYADDDDILAQADKLLCTIAGNKYVRDGKDKDRKDCLNFGESAGWDILTDQPWRPQFVAKAAKVGYQTAVTALEDSADLNVAIEKAPSTKSRHSFIPAGFAPPRKPQ